MSKKIIIGFIVFVGIMFIAILLGLFILFSSLNKEKIALTSDEFVNTFQSKGYEIVNITDQYSDYAYIQNAYIAHNGKYKIEFYNIENSDYATSFFNYNKTLFEESKGSVNSSSSANMNNYSKYTLDTNGKYKVVSRIDNTVIYINADNEFKKEIKEILDEIDY